MRNPAAWPTSIPRLQGVVMGGGVRVPTFAYWKGVIKPRRSEGLFDQADILPTFVSLAGKPGAQLAEFFPNTTYIDGVDQSGLLLADNGEAARRERIYTLNQYFAMIRIDEFKYIWTAEIENGFFRDSLECPAKLLDTLQPCNGNFNISLEHLAHMAVTLALKMSRKRRS
jgi:arylsulfatase A-like enzyme